MHYNSSLLTAFSQNLAITKRTRFGRHTKQDMLEEQPEKRDSTNHVTYSISNLTQPVIELIKGYLQIHDPNRLDINMFQIHGQIIYKFTVLTCTCTRSY